jgi:hypothetical protein
MPQSSYRIRDESLSGDAFLVVRGGLLEITTLRADAEAARRRFGTDDLGLVHLRMISGSIARNAHLLATSRPA